MFKITIAFYRVYQITPEVLKKFGVKGLLLDVDNTLTTHDNQTPAKEVTGWLDTMKKNGIKIIIVSNNHEPRVKPFANKLGLDYIFEGKKPLSKGFREAQEKIGLKKSELAAVGDQIFTDVWAANLFHIKCIYVKPMQLETTKFFKFKRFMEKPFLPKKIIYPEEEEK